MKFEESLGRSGGGQTARRGRRLTSPAAPSLRQRDFAWSARPPLLEGGENQLVPIYSRLLEPTLDKYTWMTKRTSNAPSNLPRKAGD